MYRSGAPPGPGRKCVGRAPGAQETRPDHRFVGLAALRGDDKTRNTPPQAKTQAASLRRALALIRRRFGARSIVPASALLRRAAP
jgi:hypothetical protein